ncbi:SRR1-like protein [Mytilus galloprovincialis]|uniref:SRR1-like protein n=1 Tax=Mytilus galloprovincialis TaxID=29158 RepID=UPI003F7C7DDB
MSDFQLVKSRKNRKKNTPTIIKSDDATTEKHTITDINTINRRLQDSTCLLKASEFYSQVRDLIADHDIDEIVCYGIGHFAECCIARYQLVLLVLLREDTIQIPKSSCYFYDPKFYSEEELYLKDAGFTVIPENEEGKRKTEKKTLFYMPHCGKSLYNNLIWANWNPDSLSKCIIVGNSFTNILERNPRRKLEDSCWYLLSIAPFAKEEKLPENFQYTDIFNDTVITSFPECTLKDVTLSTWEHSKEPSYNEDDLEFITNKITSL